MKRAQYSIANTAHLDGRQLTGRLKQPFFTPHSAAENWAVIISVLSMDYGACSRVYEMYQAPVLLRNGSIKFSTSADDENTV